jgi:ATP-binding cassette subfamily B protein
MGITGGLQAEAYDRIYGDRQLIRRILAYFRPHGRTVALVALAVAFASLAATITPLVISRGINMLTGNTTAQTALALAGLVTVLGALGWLLNFVRQRFAARAVGDVVLALRRDAMRAVLRRDMSFFDQYASGRIVSRVSSDTQDFSTVVTLSVDLLSQLVLIGVISIVMLVVNWRLALITIATGPVVVLVALVFRRIARRAMQQAQRAQAEVNAIVQETISGVAVAKNFRQEAAVYADFEATNNLAYRIQLVRVAVFGSIYPLMNTLAGIGVAVVVYVGGRLVISSTVTIGDWYLFVQSLTIFFYPITSIASFWSQFQQGLAASERVFALIDAESRVIQLAHEPVEQLAGRITFEHVDFHYDQGDRGEGIGVGESLVDGSPNPPPPNPQPPTRNPQPLPP